MNDYRKQRAPANADRLPPHSPEAEQGVLGCILLSPVSCLEECIKRMKPGAAVFYDHRHQEIFKVFVEMYGAGEAAAIDGITVQQRLKDKKLLEEIGGLTYLSQLPDAVPSAANLSYYLEIVLEKYSLREWVQTCVRAVAQVYEFEGPASTLLAKLEQDVLRLTEVNRNLLGDMMAPQFLKQPKEFQDEAFAHLFRDALKGEPGLELPIPFPFRVRRQECTLVSADDGAGKSTLLSYFALHLAEKESGVCIASFEEPAGVSLWRLCGQMLGRKHLPDTDAGRREAVNAVSWVNKRFWFYDFLGISDWRDVLETFRYAAEKHGVWLFILDSVMRIGIADDDYATQGFASAAFAKFAMDYNAHLFFVVHENKSDAKGKAKVRGSKLWTANANNVTHVARNVEKGEQVSKLEWMLQNERNQPADKRDEADIKEKEMELAKLRVKWDTRFVLTKQRLPGSQQNGSKHFWFDASCFQFRNHYEDLPVNWLARWRTSTRANGGPNEA